MSRSLLTLLLVSALTACAGTTQQLASDLVWPLPPDPPRVRYQGPLRSELDLGKKSSFFGRLRRTITGEDENLVALFRPRDIYVDPAGRIYVIDGPAASRITVFDVEEKEAYHLMTRGAGRITKPMGLDGDEAGRIYVADLGTKRVVVLGPDGEAVRAMGGPSLFLNPVDVAVTPDGSRVYVADSYLHQVLVFDAEGSLIRRIGKDDGDLAAKFAENAPRAAGDGDGDGSDGPAPSRRPPRTPSDLWENRSEAAGQFRFPAFVDLGPDGTLYVSDGVNFRIQAFDRDGNYVTQFGNLGNMPGSFARPKGVAVDTDGHIYVVDAAFNNVQIFDRDGRVLMAFGNIGHGPGELWLPLGIHIDRQNRIYVADRFNNRVQIYQFLGAPDASEMNGTQGHTDREPGTP